MSQTAENLVDGLIIAKCNSHGRDTKQDRRMCYQCYIKWQKVQEWSKNPRKSNCQQFEQDWLNGKFFFLYPPYIVKKLIQREVFNVIPYADRQDTKESIKSLCLPKFPFPITPEANNPEKYGYGKLLEQSSPGKDESQHQKDYSNIHADDEEQVDLEEVKFAAPSSSTTNKKKKRRTYLSVRKRQRSRSRSNTTTSGIASGMVIDDMNREGDSYSEDEDEDENEIGVASQMEQRNDIFVDNLNRSYQALAHLTEETKAYVTNQCKVMQEHLAPMQKCIQTLATLKYENEALKQQLEEREKEMQETEIIRSLMKNLEMMQGQLQKRFEICQTSKQDEDENKENDNMHDESQEAVPSQAFDVEHQDVAHPIIEVVDATKTASIPPAALRNEENESIEPSPITEQNESSAFEIQMSLEEVIVESNLGEVMQT